MEAIYGASFRIFLGLTLVLFGGIAFMTGQALARGWQPWWKVAIACLLLTLVDRFLLWALFAGPALKLSGILLDSLILVVIGSFAFRLTQIHKLVQQYPWLYERSGLLSLRERSAP